MLLLLKLVRRKPRQVCFIGLYNGVDDMKRYKMKLYIKPVYSSRIDCHHCRV